MAAGTRQAWSEGDEVRLLVPPFALVVLIVAAVADPSSAVNAAIAAISVVAFAVWTWVPRAPLAAVALAVLVPVVVAQRTGGLEPILFEASLLSFVIARWSPSMREALALGLLAALAPIATVLVQETPEISAAIWVLGILFPWVIARALLRQEELAAQLAETRAELAEQALLAERRRIARDVHDLVGHGLAAVMLQVTSARHVLRRDPAAAEEALRSAEEVGRRNMTELRGTLELLRSDEETGVAPPLPSATEISALVSEARAGGLAVELRTRGDVSRIGPGVGLAVYRIAQEALANAARHAPHGRTVLRLEQAGDGVSLVAETTGPPEPVPAGDPDRPRYGLVGMRERATALGGQFVAGPTPDGFRVSCRLPLEAGEAP